MKNAIEEAETRGAARERERMRLVREQDSKDRFDYQVRIAEVEVERDTLRTALAEAQKDAMRYRFCIDNNMILSGGTVSFGWPIAPIGKQWNEYIDAEMRTGPITRAAMKHAAIDAAMREGELT